MLEVRDLVVRYGPVVAVDGVSLSVPKGPAGFGLVGESGSGKTTIGRAIVKLVEPESGSIELDGLDVLGARGGDLKRYRKGVQIIFQDPDSTLDPRMRVRGAITEVLRAHGAVPRAGEAARVTELLEQVGLQADHADRLPHQLSGGQRQRVSIARALVSDPKILLMDEPFGALDEITRDRLNEELRRVWKETGLTILFVTHSIHEAAYLGQRVLMLAANPGRVREIVPVDLPEDRTLAVRETPEFVRLTAHLRRVLETC
jgi:NitT/TauT family transport system ATP-binding protein